MELTTRPLDPSTWPAFESLVERHNGVWGGCWCMGFHARQNTDLDAEDIHRAQKRRLVHEGQTHSAIVFDGERAVGWCQFGSPEELPRIKSRKAYEAQAGTRPDWRITCFFVDKEYRKRGVAAAALTGALREIELLGGGVVESYPEAIEGQKTSAAFLHNATLSMFERAGFERVRKIGKHRWVVAMRVPAGRTGYR